MDMRLKAFGFVSATLFVVPLHGMSHDNHDNNEIKRSGEKTPNLGRSRLAPPYVTVPVQDDSFSPPISLIPLTPEETDQKTVQRSDAVSSVPTYGTSEDNISRLLQVIATHNQYHAWLLSQEADFTVEGRPVIQIYLDARDDDQKEALIHDIESMNPGLKRRYPGFFQSHTVESDDGKEAMDGTADDSTDTIPTGFLSTTQSATAITTQSSGTQGSVSASAWMSSVAVRMDRTTRRTASTSAVSGNEADSKESISCTIMPRPDVNMH